MPRYHLIPGPKNDIGTMYMHVCDAHAHEARAILADAGDEWNAAWAAMMAALMPMIRGDSSWQGPARLPSSFAIGSNWT